MKVLLIGSGAVGGFYGAHLAKAGAEVTLLCRSDHAVVQRQGIVITSIDPVTKAEKTLTFHPHRVIRHSDEYQEQADVILVALKALPEIDLPALLAPALPTNHPRILLLQNGIGVESPVANAFPHHEILSGLAFVCLNRVAPGTIHHLGYGRLTIGRYPMGSSPMAEQLAQRFQVSGIPVQISSQILRDRWQKLVWNAPFNPLSVLGQGATTHDILQCPATAQLAAEIMSEVIAIAQAEGYTLGPELIQKNLNDTERMMPYRTSMLMDYQSHRPMEIEAILGQPLRVAGARGVTAPRMATLYALLQLLNRPSTVPQP
ncbi:MAG: 2-dehydropantoate 2-reductase [Magnetococcales bacterium]|nr:2-dehydropantoate 2-reductase [Magnetococcales bacterium]